MAESSTLKLVLDKGPRKGETLEFRPGSVVRLGRVVRGNSVTIKEAGISSKHLSISFDNASGKWLITDLDSSNGTILNDTNLAANTPFHLSDGDTVKLGELTSIIVKIGGDVSVVRRSRRQAVPASGVVGKEEEVVGERSELGLEFKSNFGGNVAERPKQKGQQRKEKNEGNEAEIVNDIRNDVVETKKSRGRPKGKCQVSENEVEIVNEAAEKKTLRGRPKKGVDLGNEVEERLFEVKNVKEIGNVASVEVKQGRQLRSRTTRNSKKEDIAKLNSVIEEFSEPLESLSAIQRKARKGRGKKKVIEDETSTNFEKDNVEVREVAENLVTDLPEVVLDQDAKESIMNQSSEQLRVEDVLETKDVEQMEEGSGVKDGHVDLGMEPDLEKMTLGEWFDFLEVYLPKQIYNETEELISNMKQRAKHFHDYKLEQERAREKGKAPMA